MDASSPMLPETPRAAGQADLLHRLPNEILLDVLKSCRDATSLWSLIHTSRRLSALFNAYALEILAPVLHAAVPTPTPSLMCAVVQLRTGTAKFWWGSWDTAQRSVLRNMLIGPFGPGATPAIVRRLVGLAHRIEVLAHTCLVRCMRRCINTRPPEVRAALAAAGQAEEGPPGRGYRVDAPCWIEEQRAVLAFWRLQVFYELKAAGVEGRLAWSERDLASLRDATVATFYNSGVGHSWQWDQVATANEFVEQLGGITAEDIRFHEDRVGAAAEKDGSPRDVSNYLRRLRLPDCPKRNPNSGWSWPDRPVSRTAAAELWGGKERLDSDPAGWLAYWGRRWSDIYLLSWTDFSSYRRYGFAFWTMRRLIDWGFCEYQEITEQGEIAQTGKITKKSPSYQAWRALLSEEERQEAFMLMLDAQAVQEEERELAREAMEAQEMDAQGHWGGGPRPARERTAR